MSYSHSMACHTAGIRVTQPVRWRSLDGVMGVFWQAEGQAGASGYYLSPDPRFVLFMGDVSDHIAMSNARRLPEGPDGHARPMTRAVYVPAGMPLWTRFSRPHGFAHLDLHLPADRLLGFLTPGVGAPAAQAAIRRPVEMQDAGTIGVLAGLLADEIARPARHRAFAESLVGAIATGMLDLSQTDAGPVPPRASGGLTPAQMRRLRQCVGQSRDGRLSVAQMAAAVGLSDSWFASAFKATTGTTPRLWQLNQRIATVRDLLTDSDLPLSDIAARAGFADQSHLTRSFRQITGTTPAAWRRTQRLG
ncbi:AraC family transcriptional regulator [Paracoccus nototheniae]|uniref:Helix-turn-helix domain-containing protein n=1 Tax=Paracoccus nototheniae TaxID=2489002 RepID=A0ABW4E0D1_9RHOB|nr:AraC family transcriptional regulator [Paracoccus nototheniae]